MEIKFAEKLKILRTEFGYTQQELATKLNTTQRKVFYWESKKTEPDLKSLLDISILFNVSIDYLIGKIDY